MTDKPTPTDAATPECLTCSDHGAVGNILTAEPCPDCTRWNVQPAPATQQAGAGEPFGYFHQLLNHDGKGTGVWLGAAERKVVEQAHTPGETSEEIVTLYATPQPTSPQADSVPAVSDLPPLPAPDLRDVGTKPQEIKEFLKGYATEYARTAIAARAPADSVQEDAADPLQGAANWLAEAHGQFSPVVLSGCLMIGYNRAKRLHDAALAARKQGEKQ